MELVTGLILHSRLGAVARGAGAFVNGLPLGPLGPLGLLWDILAASTCRASVTPGVWVTSGSSGSLVGGPWLLSCGVSSSPCAPEGAGIPVKLLVLLHFHI